jgi:hypothetical protein
MYRRILYLLIVGLMLSCFGARAQRVRQDTVPPDSMVEPASEDDETETDTEISIVADTVRPFEATLVTSEVQRPVSPQAADARSVEQMRRDPDFWYVDRERKKVKEAEPSFLLTLFSKAWFGYLFWTVVIGGFIALVVWFLASSEVSFFKTRKKADTADDPIEEESIFSIAYEREIAAATAAGNLPLAIRLMYLQMLKELSDRSLIQYKQERTNSDYLGELYGTAYYPDFFRLTRHFEYAWYGRFPVTPAAFETIGTDYQKLKSRFS